MEKLNLWLPSYYPQLDVNRARPLLISIPRWYAHIGSNCISVRCLMWAYSLWTNNNSA